MRQRPHQITRAEIAKEVGVDQKLVRYYFPDIETLLDEALDQGMKELDQRMAAASRTRGPAAAVLEKRLTTLASYLVENPGYFRALVDRIYNGSTEYAAKRLMAMTRRAYRRHEKLVRTAQADQQFRADFDPRFLYIAIIGMVEIFVTAMPVVKLLFPNEEEQLSQNYQAFIVDLILRGIVTKQHAPHD